MGIIVAGSRGGIGIPAKVELLVHHYYRTILRLRGFRNSTRISIHFISGRRVEHLGTRCEGVSERASILSFPLNRGNICSIGLSANTGLLNSVIVSVRGTVRRTRLCGRPLRHRVNFLAIRSVLRLLNCSRRGNNVRTIRVHRGRRAILARVN